LNESAVDIAESVRSGARSAAAVLGQSLAAIRARNAAVNAFVLVDEAGAARAAAELDRQIAAGVDPGRLAGVPIGVKDMRDDCAGLPTRNGSLLSVDAPPAQQDSKHVARLRRAGAIIVGKTATAEFGLDGVTHTLLHGTTRNPWNLQRTSSGSSGGSSAAVGAAMVPLATGGDGLGSIRCPAGFTGLVGLKPSLGRIPRQNGFTDTSAPGCLTTTVRDTARYLDVVAGPDDRDRMTLPAANAKYEQLIETLDVRGLRAVWSTDLGFAPVEPEVEQVCRDAAYRLIEAAQLQLVADRFSCTNAYVAWNALAAVRLRRLFESQGFLPDRLAEMSPGPRRFVERYAYQDESKLVAFEATVMKVEQEMAALFANVDVLLTPTACCVPYAAEGPLPETIAGKDASETNGEPFTALASIAWNPSISVPAGLSSDGLPIGLLINVRRHRDDIALRLARVSEQVNPWPRHPPAFC
jgi:aspartyl-tRNA(Asn)/glutamyl-tRNA(Gln) amidotransferase subunit A